MFNLDDMAILNEVYEEYRDACTKHGPIRTPHDGYAVILEELDELWDLVKANESREKMRHEAKQIAAMGLRFIFDLCDFEVGR